MRARVVVAGLSSPHSEEVVCEAGGVKFLGAVDLVELLSYSLLSIFFI